MQQIEDVAVFWRLRPAVVSLQDMTALCPEDSGIPERTTGTEFSLELSASVVHGGVALCVLFFLQRTPVGQTVTMEDKYEITYGLSKGMIADDLK